MVVNVGGDRWVQPLGFYATVISHRISPGFFAGRRASTVVAALNVALVFMVAWRLFGHWLPALAAAIVLIVTPAHYAHGRLGTDAIYVVPFILIWLHALLRFIERDRSSAVGFASAALGAGVYSTPSAPLMMAALWLAMMIVLWTAGRRKLWTLVDAIAGFTVMLLPLAGWFYLHPDTYASSYGRWAVLALPLSNPVAALGTVVDINAIATWVTAPLIAAGIVRCVQLASRTSTMLVLAGAAITALAAAIFGEGPTPALGLLPFVALLAGYGVDLIRSRFAPEPVPADEW